MIDNRDFQKVPFAAVYHQQWLNWKYLKEHRVRREDGKEEKDRLLGRCLLSVRRAWPLWNYLVVFARLLNVR